MPEIFGQAHAEQPVGDASLPRFAHVVIVVEENTDYNRIIGNEDAAFINRLARHGALFTRSYGVAHPSQPNYLALFSGDTQKVRGDRCPVQVSGPNLASALDNTGLSFAIFSQSMPETGFTGCRHGEYARKHNPAVNWQGDTVSLSQNRAFSAFGDDFDALPTVAFVVPDLEHDMHSASIGKADDWLAAHLGAYARWAADHDSLLIVTWDEDDYRHHNHIPTLIAGAHVDPGQYTRPINHYSLLRTLEAIYDLPLLGHSAQAAPITDIWRRADAVALAGQIGAGWGRWDQIRRAAEARGAHRVGVLAPVVRRRSPEQETNSHDTGRAVEFEW